MTALSEVRDFSRVAEELSPPLRRFLRRYIGEEAAAEDLLQETLIRVARGLPSFQGRASLKTWAFSIATRVAADHLRQPSRRVRIVALGEPADSPEAGLAAPPEVEERLVIDEMNACVRQFVDSLPEDYRAALVLHDLEGLSVAETAEISGCSLPTAKIRIHRARARLREILRQECDFYHDRADVLRCDRKP